MGSRESIVIDMHVFDLIWENAMESEDPICLTAVSVAICDDRRDCHCRNGEPGYEVIPAPLRRFGASPIFCQRSAREDCIYLLPMTTVGIASCQAESKVECFFFLAVGISTVRAHTHTHTLDSIHSCPTPVRLHGIEAHEEYTTPSSTSKSHHATPSKPPQQA